jgi:hypothetical protein
MSFRADLTRGVPKGILRFTKPKPAMLDAMELPAADRALLEEGWPTQAAPWLSFDFGSQQCGPVSELLEHVHDARHLEHLIGIGGDGGIIVCVEQGTGRVMAVDHETGEAEPMNASMRTLATAILAYAHAPKVAGQLEGSAREEVRARIATVDPDALTTGRFWARHTS